MPSTIDTRPALAAIDEKRVLDLEQRSIRIPSSTFEEGNIADLYADYMSGHRPRGRDAASHSSI